MLTFDSARAALDEGIRIAGESNHRISIVIVDAFAREVVSARMDGANWFTLGVARDKAQTAATFRRPSHGLAKLRGDYPELFPHIDDQVPFRVTALPGGVPLGAEPGAGGAANSGPVLGAVGVSGAHPDEDLRIAGAIAEFFGARTA